MKDRDVKKLAVLVNTKSTDIDLIYNKMRVFSDYVSIRFSKTFDIYDIPQDAYDVIIVKHFGYYNKHVGSGEVRKYGTEIIHKALSCPEKLFLFLTRITEIETMEMLLECLPDENICLPNNIFLNWDDFIKQLRLMVDLLDPSQKSDLSLDIFRHYDDMPLLLRALLSYPGNGKKFYSDFDFNHWDDYFTTLEKQGVSWADPLMLRSITLSGSRGGNLHQY